MERAYETYVTTLEALITPDNTIKRITLKSAENEKHTIVVEFTMPKGAELQRATAFFNRALDDFSKGAPKDSADARDTKIKKRGARAATKKGKKS
jgi:hypothetical protein